MAWPSWSRRDPQGLARYVTPEAREWLTLGRSRFDIDPTPQGRLQLVRAIYQALAQERIHYDLEEYNPSASLQPIREPSQILRRPREGTCLDLAVLFCGLCIANRLLPTIVVLGGHALSMVSLTHELADWDGYRPEREYFDKGPVDDPEAFSQVVDLVDGGAYVAIECTGFAASEKLAQLARQDWPETVGRKDGLLPFERATAAGREQLSLPDRPLQFALDIAVAHYAWRIEPFAHPAEPMPDAPTPREAPPSPSVFVGRQAEVTRLRSALVEDSDEPVTVLYGMAGVGKTAVAQKVLADAELDERFPDGTFWFDLRSTDVMAALEHIALAYGHSVAAQTVVDSRAALVRSILRDKRVVITLDGLDDASSALLLCTGRPSAVLATTIDRDLAFRLTSEAIPVDPLLEADAICLLEALIGAELSSRDKRSLRRIATLLGGLPLALELAARLVNRQITSGWESLDDVIEALERAGATLDLGLHDRRVRAIFESTYRRALDSTRRDLFAKLGVFRPGVLELEEIAAAWGVTADAARLSVEELTSLSLVDRKGKAAFQLQPLLQQYAGDLFRAGSEAEQINVHHRVAAYYKRWVHGYEEAQQQQTLCWYRFERPDWQDRQRRLLYHLSRVPERDVGRLAFARLYFDAFWWWGSYVRFDYCEQLLEDWAATYDGPDDRRWFQELTTFARSYPIGLGKQQGDWAAVEHALLNLWQLAGIDGEASAIPSGEPRHVRAITGLFLAQASRFLGDLGSAHARYEEAAELLEEAGEWWDLAWALFDHADMDIDSDETDAAKALGDRAMSIVVDHALHQVELRSNLYRIEADVAWRNGDLDQAFSAYALATFYAYRFQALPHPPDVYTLTFYREMVDRTVVKLSELVSTGRTSEAQHAIHVLTDFWKPYWSSVGQSPAVDTGPSLVPNTLGPLVAPQFPPQPSERKLTSRSVRYARQFSDEVRRHTDAMAATLDPLAWGRPRA